MQAFADVGAMVSGLLAGSVTDYWGRKTALIWGGIPYLAGYLMLSYAHYLPTPLSFQSVALAGRLLTGISMGWVSMATPVSL